MSLIEKELINARRERDAALDEIFAEAEALRRERDELRTSLAEAMQQCRDTQDRLTARQAECRELVAERDELAQAMADMQKNIHYLEGLRHGWSAHAADLAQRVADLGALVAERDAARAELERAREASGALVDEIDDLMNESDGVAGLHRNGDVADWSELVPGGRFERLSSLGDVRALAAKGE